MKFKIGDRVVCTANTIFVRKGCTGTVHESSCTPWVRWDNNVGVQIVHENCLALLEDTHSKVGFKVDLSWVKGKAREVVSESIQKKAFELGYEWDLAPGNRPVYQHKPYLFFKDKRITMSDDMIKFNSTDHEELRVNDALEGKFLAKEKYMPKEGEAVLVRKNDVTFWTSNVSRGYLSDGNYIMCDGYSYPLCIPFDIKLLGKRS